MGTFHAELGPGRFSDGWVANLSERRSAFDRLKPSVVVCSFTLEGRNGQHGFEIDEEGVTIFQEPVRYVGAVLQTDEDVTYIADIMGLPTPTPILQIRPRMPELAAAFRKNLRANKLPNQASLLAFATVLGTPGVQE